MSFGSLLIANRGEIAVRVIRTARRLGYRTVAVFSEADRGSPHVEAADSAVYLGPSPAAESYLRGDRIISAAEAAGAEAIHPGYGFLSEDAAFARTVEDAGLTWVGPPAAAIEAMGDKAAAKRLMEEAGVPLLPGYHGSDQSDEELAAAARRLGFPLMVKAAAGGGGKGMRLVTTQDMLPDAIAAARREAIAGFGSGALILERALLRPRHVEIQVLADAHGNTVSLGERDCSIQRRHQKILEEAPSPAVGPELRARMGQAAIDAVRAVDYVGAGTVEFLLEPDAVRGTNPGGAEFFFLEANTRLQVEHPVTELVTEVDIVEWQLRVAQGEPLDVRLGDVRQGGHAMEVRLYAEDPVNDFLPAAGAIEAFDVPTGVRVDTGVTVGSVVGTHYDPMIAKIIAHGPDRDTARRRLRAALIGTTLLGPTTNRSFLIDVLDDPTFVSGTVTTAFLADVDLPRVRPLDTATVAAAVGIVNHQRTMMAERRSPQLAGWSNRANTRVPLHVAIGGERHDVALLHSHQETVCLIGDRAIPVVADGDAVTVNGRRTPYRAVVRSPDRFAIRLAGRDLEVCDVMFTGHLTTETEGHGLVAAPMHGTVAAVRVDVGTKVARGQVVAVLEAMKMEHTVVADIDGTVVDIVARVGNQVAAKDLLVVISPEGVADDDE